MKISFSFFFFFFLSRVINFISHLTHECREFFSKDFLFQRYSCEEHSTELSNIL